MRPYLKYVLLSLAIGLFIGSSCTFFAMHYRNHGEWRPRPFGGMRQKFYRDLNLTPEQRSKVDAVLHESRQKIDGVRGATRDEIRKMLSTEQQSKFDAANARMDARRKKFMDRRARPHD